MSNWRDDDYRGSDYYGVNDRGDLSHWREDRDRKGHHDDRREESGDWKRRRTNGDGYASISDRHYEQGEDDYSYDDSYYEEGGNGRQQQYGNNNLYNGGSGGSRSSRARGPSSEPSEHVIFLGLDPDFTEPDLSSFLSTSGYNVANTTIIRDRTTGMSKCFGFAQFSSLQDAQNFVEMHFPFVRLPPPSFVSSTVSEDEDRSRRVKIDYSQSANPDAGSYRTVRPHRPPGHGGETNDGTRDIGSAHVPVILLRGLDVSSIPDTIAEALRSSEGPGKRSAKGLKRVVLIRDRVSKISLGIAFVEFVDVKSASIVLANTMSPTLFPNGFRISGIPVAASFAHTHSFILTPDDFTRDDACVDASLALGGRDHGYARYWDENAVLSEMQFEIEVEEKKSSSRKGKEKDKEKERKKPRTKEHDDSGLPPGITNAPVPTALKESAAPITMSLKFSKANDPAFKTSATVISANKLVPALPFANEAIAEEEATLLDSQDKTSTYRRVPPMIASRKVANNIMKWNNVQGELKVEEGEPPAVETPQTPPIEAPAAQSISSEKVSPSPAVEDLVFGDTKKLACLLCSRQFKTLDQLRRHSAESDLHKKNLGDASLCELAHTKAEAARKAAEAESAPKYRDRALERRVIYGQPDVPPPSADANGDGSGAGGGVKRKYADGPAPAPAPLPPPAPVNPGEDEKNKGNMLLKKMGWSAGTGLGLSGEGRVEPIMTAIYAQGAGLGASKGKEIGTGGDPFDYASSVKSSARDRFQSS